MNDFSDFFLASDDDLAMRGIPGRDGTTVDIGKLPCRPSMTTSGLDFDQVLHLAGQLAGWTGERVEAEMQTRVHVPRQLTVAQLAPALTAALARRKPPAKLAGVIRASDEWLGARLPWDETEFVHEALEQLHALALDAGGTGRHLCWWSVDGELLK